MSDNEKKIKSSLNNGYDDDSISVLKGLEPVRLRPGMYIGSTGINGLHHLVWEIIDNSVDEALAGFAKKIQLILKQNNIIEVIDDGRGVPVGINAETKISNLETVLTVLHAGGKFDNETYKVSGGLHGVGASCVNALSEWLVATVWRDNNQYQARFENGGEIVLPTHIIAHDIGDKTGTSIEWRPDFTIMEKNDYDPESIKLRLQRLAYLNKGINFVFTSQILNQVINWQYDNGLIHWVNDLNQGKDLLHTDVIYGEHSGKVKSNLNVDNAILVEFALQYTKNYESAIYSFCNNIDTRSGGTHEEGFKQAILKVLRKKALDNKLVKDLYELNKNDVLEGLTAIVSLRFAAPQYDGQTKEKLGNTEVTAFVRDVVEEVFERYLDENPEIKKLILWRVILAKDNRLELEKQKDIQRKSLISGFSSLPGKLADCATKNRAISELYIVEGDSAGGSAKNGREREFQAILPLRGKVINAEKSKSIVLLENKEIQSLISAIGCGYGPIFDLTKLRYNKIIIMTDADVDGSHIRVLLLTFFFSYMQELINNGNVYIAQPPLYKLSFQKQIHYVYNDHELEKFKQAHPDNFERYEISRFKGLGEMSPEQLWETTMNPKNRTLLKVTIQDAILASRMFTDLMGSDPEPRRKFILEHAKNVKNLDV